MVTKNVDVTARNQEKSLMKPNQVKPINLWDPNNRITEALLVDNITLRTSLANTKRKAKHLRYELQRSLAKNNAVEIEKREASEKYAAHLMALKGSVKNCQEIANRISGRQIVAHSLENYNLVIENTVLLAEKLSLQKQVEILDEKLLKFKSAAKAAQGRRKKEKMEAID